MELRNIKKVDLLKSTASPTALLNIEVNPEGNRNTLNALSRLLMKTPAEELEITIKKKTKRRSNKANSYMWVLLGKIADELGTTANTMYLEYVMGYGVYEDVSVAKRNERFEMANHMANGLGFIAVRLDEDRDNKDNVIIREYKGTSQYTQEEFNRLLNAVVEGAKELDIDVKEMSEII